MVFQGAGVFADTPLYPVENPLACQNALLPMTVSAKKPASPKTTLLLFVQSFVQSFAVSFVARSLFVSLYVSLSCHSFAAVRLLCLLKRHLHQLHSRSFHFVIHIYIGLRHRNAAMSCQTCQHSHTNALVSQCRNKCSASAMRRS